MQSATPTSGNRNDEFVRLFVEHQRRIHAFIATLLPNRTDAEDVLQETSVVAWQIFDKFETGSDFVRWACTVAKLEVLKFRRQQKSGRLVFSDALLEDLADRQMQQSDFWKNWHQKLADCVEKLRPVDRKIFLDCSRSDTTIKQVAAELRCPANTIYKAISRIRRFLIDCVHRAISREDHER